MAAPLLQLICTKFYSNSIVRLNMRNISFVHHLIKNAASSGTSHKIAVLQRCSTSLFSSRVEISRQPYNHCSYHMRPQIDQNSIITCDWSEGLKNNRSLDCLNRFYSTNSGAPPSECLTQLSAMEYEEVVEETLQSLTDMWEELGEELDDDIDINYASGVLTVKLGSGHGTYVINKQTPNKQIWFSSPLSGPKRYDYIDKEWKYKHDDQSLHERLSAEISGMYKRNIDFTTCQHGAEQH